MPQTARATAQTRGAMTVEPCVLEGTHVRLEPLSTGHLDALAAIGLDPDLWRWTLTRNHTPEDMRQYVETALAEQRAGQSLPFAKFLMLRHAFEVWRCLRVELKANSKNERSRRAILRIGATEEGTLRKHQLHLDGTSRDSVYFSVIDDEWPSVKQRLEGMMADRR